MSQFTNKTVVVTGGTDGIGRALVLNFLELGANVVTCGRSQQKILALEAEAPMGRFVCSMPMYLLKKIVNAWWIMLLRCLGV